MSEAVLEIKGRGKSLGVRLPEAVARAARLQAGQHVRITVEGDSVIISPYAADAQSLKTRLARFCPARHGGEAIAATPMGAERC